jgi:ketosteroid isomerase-like protein
MDSPLDRLKVLYEEWSRGDFSREIFDADTVNRGVGWLDMDVDTRGADRIRGVMREWMSAWEDPTVVEVDELIESGDRILALVRWRGRGKGSGVEVEMEGAHLWTFREGRVLRFDVYRDRDQARAALGRDDPGGN